jgi:hypothetical protein
MSTTTLDIIIRASGKEVFTAAEAPAAASEADRTMKTGANALVVSYTPSSTPPVSKPLVSLLIDATGTVNLAAVAAMAIPAGATRTVDLTGGKMVLFILRAPKENAAAVTVAPGASNPYPLFGAGNSVEVKVGQFICAGFEELTVNSYAAVGPTAKNIDVTITGSDKLYLELYLG